MDDRGGSSIVRRMALLVGVLAFVGLLAFGLFSKAPDTGIDDALAESRAVEPPGFELPVLQEGMGPGVVGPVEGASADGSVSLDELEGTPVVLNFWASWCVPCREEAAVLERAWRASGDEGVAVIGLNMQDLTEDANAFLREFDVSYPNIRDESNDVAVEWGVTALPETFFVSAEGEVVGHVIGQVSAEQLERGIAAARSGTPIGALSGGDRRPSE